MMVLFTCSSKPEKLSIDVFVALASGNKLTRLQDFIPQGNAVEVKILPSEKFQTITGFGGAFTESSAYLLNQLSKENRKKIIDAYFSSEGANYSLTRTHMNSCDFSLGNYSYTPLENEPLGNNNNWESMHYTPEEMLNFVANHLARNYKPICAM